MKKPTDREILEALAKQPPVAAPRSAEAFWPDFRARARMRTQETAQVERPRITLVWSAPLACAAALVIAAGLYMFSSPAQADGTTIKSIEVVASHSAVLIMQDEETESTVLWVAGLQQEAPSKDNI